MKKKEIIFSLFFSLMGLFLIYGYNPFMKQSNFLGFIDTIVFLVGCLVFALGTMLPRYALQKTWKKYWKVKNPFTLEEWRMVGHKTMIQEGIIPED